MIAIPVTSSADQAREIKIEVCRILSQMLVWGGETALAGGVLLQVDPGTGNMTFVIAGFLGAIIHTCYPG